MRQRTLDVLEFNKIKALIESEAVSELGVEKVKALAPATDYDTVVFQMDETDEIAQIYNKHRMPSISGLTKVSPLLQRAQIGSILNVSELNQIKRLIQVQNQFKTFYNQIKEEEESIRYPILDDRMQQLPILSDLYQSIHEKCDAYDLYDHASYELQSIRSKITSTTQRVRQNLDRIVKSQGNQKKLSDAIVTVRNERNVIPVKAEYRQDFNGIVHDQSASGQTLYIEPAAVVEMNNQISRLRQEEATEVERILSILTNEVAEEADACQVAETIMGQIDFLTAKARYARKIKGTKPTFSTEAKQVYLPKAFHPLLDRETVVANTISFARDIEMVIITGPNTGGKTVTLKTLGLIIVMAQSGLLIPTLDGSQLSVFDNVYCDIGDEQSIEQSLSTFSSHMKNIVEILEHTDKRSLILFDELGAGTDPSEGAALAMSILDHVRKIGSLVMATTHYPELKAYSYNREGVMNASVEFDVETLSPTYKLLMGVPGRSNAFDISKKLGLRIDIIQKAKSMIGQDEQEINAMIASLETNAKRVEDEKIELDQLLREAQMLHDDLSKAYAQYQSYAQQMRDEAREKANQRVKAATKEADDILKDLRTLRDTKGADVKEHELIEKRKGLEHQYEAASLKQHVQKQKYDTIHVGDEVKVLSYGQKGEVISLIDDTEAVVQMGIIKMKLPIDDLEKKKKQKETPTKMVTRQNRSTVKTELDLRGYRYEEALIELDQYLDQAVLSNYENVYIIHGKGTGALQKGVQNHLKRHKSVASYRIGMPSEGGFGVTVATLK